MTTCPFTAFLPELALLAGSAALFLVTLGDSRAVLARRAALLTAIVFAAVCALSLCSGAVLFGGAYRVDAFSQWIKLAIACSYVLVLLLGDKLPDIPPQVQAEYHLFMALSVTGLVMLASSVEFLTLVIALELSSFPLYMMVTMRRERGGQRSQMESAIKYIMFGVAANGIMLFGLSYLYGLTGTTHLPEMFARLQPVVTTPAAVAGLGLAFCGLFYKLAVVPFHFWTPDVYQGSSNETAGFIASMPKIGGCVVLVRFASLATPENTAMAALLACLAGVTMCYGNLIALVQSDFKRLLGFSGIAHAGYAMMGFTALGPQGFTAALYYIVAYVLMVMACFVVICRVSRDGANVPIEELAGLHRRSPLLALTLLVGIFALAGMPPFAGFMGKLSLLTAALERGHLMLVILAMVNSAIAIWYYLQVVRRGLFGEVEGKPAPLAAGWPTRILCVLLIAGITWLGVAPAAVMDAISASLAGLNLPLQ